MSQKNRTIHSIWYFGSLHATNTFELFFARHTQTIVSIARVNECFFFTFFLNPIFRI